MEGTESPSLSLFNLDSWLRSSDRRVVWAGVSISTTLVDRVHRAFAGLASSMNVCGSPLTQWLWGEDSAAEEASRDWVIVGQLRGTKSGAVPRLLAPHGFHDVRVDRFLSRVGNPFKANVTSDACLAFDLLTTLALLHGAADGTAHLTWPPEDSAFLPIAGLLERVASSLAVCPGFCRFNSLGGLTISLSQPCWLGSSLTRGYSRLASGCDHSAGAATRHLPIGLGPTSVTRNHWLLLFYGWLGN